MNIKLDVFETSDYLNICVSMVRKLVSEKQIPFYKIGRKVLFDKNEIDDWWITNKKN
ncbi:MAG: helix-turn-helix domain-containing protein [Ignavibacteriales bacterium]